MRQDTMRDVEGWWRSQLLVGDQLWMRATVRQRSGLPGDGQRWFVAWRQGGVHVVAPSDAEARHIATLQEKPAADLQRPDFWSAFAHQHAADLMGPNVYRYLDEDPGRADEVVEVAPSKLHDLRDQVLPVDLWESGFDVHLDAPNVVAFAMDGGGAVLTDVGGAPRNVAILVTPEARGQGVGTALGRAAASYAVHHHRWCRWRSSVTNRASSRIAEHLGFEAYATQLGIRYPTPHGPVVA